MVDWEAIQTWAIGAVLVAFIFGFILAAFARLVFYEFVAHPTVQKFAKVAEKFGGKDGGGILDKIVKGILDALSGK